MVAHNFLLAVVYFLILNGTLKLCLGLISFSADEKSTMSKPLLNCFSESLFECEMRFSIGNVKRFSFHIH